mgnify:FL=1
MAVSAKVVADSKFRDTRLITLEVEMHRFILAENNTHKAQSRNIQSSRAIPILRQLEQIANDPAMPVEYRKNKSGMVAGEELSPEEIEEAKKIILWMRDCCLFGVEKLHKIGLAKQWANRYVEPWMWTKGVVTATETAWKAMFKLRCHYASQPEIRVLFEAIESAISDSRPQMLRAGDWHLPYFEGVVGKGYWDSKEEVGNLKDAIKVSTSCVAQVSYRKLDDSLEKAENVYAMLNLPSNGVYPDDPPHFSPTEHIARAGDVDDIEKSGNFHSTDFIQYRKALEMGIEEKLF